MQQAPALPAAKPGEPAVKLSRASFAWAPGESPTLCDVSVEARAGQLVMVVGEVGAGKSSLLAAVLGEMQREAVRSETSARGC